MQTQIATNQIAKTTHGAVQLASSHLITTCATLAATAMFVATGSEVMTGAIGGAVQQNMGLVVAFLLNIAIILFGWRRASDLKSALAAYAQAEQQAHANAFVDHTTGLANRRELMRILTAERGTSEASALLLLDLAISRRSTTSRAIAPATRCSRPSPKRSSGARPRARAARGSAAMNSPS